ncbi:Os02g0242300 [Oryza sativa Japonica Group]|uniref:Os02g0242300 protein n=1 Tax=Oryza sativa subsp. japonica TaxID=39947 RepID=A0A0P0VGY7_ORYSJ|nr:Os02g0242300 [Oryza sativa Japonica Group]
MPYDHHHPLLQPLCNAAAATAQSSATSAPPTRRRCAPVRHGAAAEGSADGLLTRQGPEEEGRSLSASHSPRTASSSSCSTSPSPSSSAAASCCSRARCHRLPLRLRYGSRRALSSPAVRPWRSAAAFSAACVRKKDRREM